MVKKVLVTGTILVDFYLILPEFEYGIRIGPSPTIFL